MTKDFQTLAEVVKNLIDLHQNYESGLEYNLQQHFIGDEAQSKAHYKMS